MCSSHVNRINVLPRCCKWTPRRGEIKLWLSVWLENESLRTLLQYCYKSGNYERPDGWVWLGARVEPSQASLTKEPFRWVPPTKTFLITLSRLQPAPETTFPLCPVVKGFWVKLRLLRSLCFEFKWNKVLFYSSLRVLLWVSISIKLLQSQIPQWVCNWHLWRSDEEEKKAGDLTHTLWLSWTICFQIQPHSLFHKSCNNILTQPLS